MRSYCSFLKPMLIVSVAVWLVACGGSGGDDTIANSSGVVTPPPSSARFINWNGSANGTLVNDATDDFFQFREDTRQMYFGSTTINNVYVDGNAELFMDGIDIGCVCAVLSTVGTTIAGVISNNGFYLDFYGPESTLLVVESTKGAVFARPLAGKSDEEGFQMQYGMVENSGPNMIVENLVEGSATAKKAP